MAVIETRYSVGDVVYHAGTATEQKKRSCPDCNDTKIWHAISPAGNEYSFSCPRCSARYNGMDKLSLNYTAHAPFVRRLTIGSVRYNSHYGSYDHGAQYMCEETGVGGGSVYSESDLFSTHDEAMVAATARAAKADVAVEYVAASYNAALEICDYQLESAALKRAREAASQAGQLLWGVEELFETITEADGKDAIAEAIDDYKKYQRPRDIARLIAVADEARADLRVSA